MGVAVIINCANYNNGSISLLMPPKPVPAEYICTVINAAVMADGCIMMVPPSLCATATCSPKRHNFPWSTWKWLQPPSIWQPFTVPGRVNLLLGSNNNNTNKSLTILIILITWLTCRRMRTYYCNRRRAAHPPLLSFRRNPSCYSIIVRKRNVVTVQRVGCGIIYAVRERPDIYYP